MKKKKDLIKASASIAIHNKANLLQRRAWNVLLANAYDDLLGKDFFSIHLKEIVDYLGYNSNDLKHLKESVKGLMGCIVEWDILDKDGDPVWEANVLLAHARIEKGVLTYAYSPGLKDKLYNPKMYARIKLSMQNKFNSKYTLALYELLTDYFRQDKKIGETPWIDIEDFKKLMGVDGQYSKFKDLNKWLIKTAIREINEKSNLWTSVEKKRDGRFIAYLKFLIKPNPRKENLFDIPDPPKKPRSVPQQESLLPQIDLSSNETFMRLREAGLSIKQANKFMAHPQLKPQLIESIIDDADDRFFKGQIHTTRTGYIVATLNNLIGETDERQFSFKQLFENSKPRGDSNV